MRGSIVAMSVLAIGLSAAGVAWAQTPPNAGTQYNGDSGTIAVPPAPAIVAEPSGIQPVPVPATPPPPGLVPSAPPADADTGDSTPAFNQTPPTDNPAAGQPTAAPDAQLQDIAPIPPNTWLPAKMAKIGVLDKIDGSVSEVSIPVGSQSVVGDLQVSVQACMIRPPDQVPDAAIFLALQSAGDSSAPPNYQGWLVRSAPGAAVAGDASETFRVINCS